MQQFLIEFFGHFHPVVVHLPIGILLIAALFHALASTEKYRSLRPAVAITLFIGMLSAILACITGFLLSLTDDYDAESVERHQWFGIATAIISYVCYASEKRQFRYQSWLVGLMVLMITLTGHLGGTLTHGDGYLTEAFDNYSGEGEKREHIANVQDALAYEDVVRPILANNCYGCHSSRKQKGGLRLDNKEFILKGGKNGFVIVPGDAAGSKLVHRIFIALENEDHMPPKEKSQPTASEKDLIKWWVASGASFEKKVRDLNQPSDIRNVLTALENEGDSKLPSSVPEVAVVEANSEILVDLQKRGVTVLPVAQNSNYLSANLINADASDDSLTLKLLSLDKQLVWLKTASYPINDESLKRISELKALTRLQIGNLDSKNALQYVSKLKNLLYLNLTGAEITTDNVGVLANLNSLQTLHLFDCNISSQAYHDLRKLLPTAKIDTGGYVVPTLASDTTEVTVGKR